MPARTSKLRPIIVYVPDNDYREIEQLARENDRSISYVARRLIATGLRARGAAMATMGAMNTTKDPT